ncbi:MAG TPA: hypothetical protein DD381_12850 [Lentisphaeria bacterium]|nr:MAG: hypothetical protein A2X47_12420 [Lentisphaerae bacterium GWF2_38_69]HBM17213.1 hypothetical protein [Lentisphaeria bacterium]
MIKLNKNYILYLLTSIVFLMCSANDIYLSSLPKMVQDFNSTPNVINLTLSFYALGTAVFVLFADLLNARYGRRPIILISLIVFTASAFLISISPSIWGIILLRIVQSSGLGLYIISSTLVIKDIMDEREQIRAIGIILAGLVISPAISPVIGAYLAQHFGWRSCFVFNGILGAILLIFTFKILPETNFSKLDKLPKMGPYLMRYFMVFKDTFFLHLTLIMATGSGAYFAFIGISSYLFIDNLGISPILYSYIYIFLSAAFLVGNHCLQTMNRKKTSFKIILGIGSAASLAGSIVILSAEPFSSSFIIAGLLTIGAIIMRWANALVNPTTQVLTVNRFKKRGGVALGMAMSIAIGAQGIAVILVTLFHSEPLFGLALISMLLSIIGLISFFLVKKRITDS